jgi:protein-S-isoprenylcysteine O-methyltransferase
VNLPFPTLPLLLTVVLVGEVGLMRNRLSTDASRQADRGSLRMLFVIIFGSVGLAWLAGRSVPQARFESLFELGPTTLWGLYAAGLSLFATGVALRWYSVAYLGRLFTYDVAIAADHRVVDTGPYRHIRHPAYTGSLMTFLGLGLCGGNALSLPVLVLPIGLAFLHRIAIEEAALTAALGSRYADYASRTRRLVPFVY